MSRDAYRDDRLPLSARADELRQKLSDLADLETARREAEQELASLEGRLREMRDMDAKKKRSLPMLDRISVAEPCQANWDDMVAVPTEADGPNGVGDRVRFCGLCAKNVFNLSEMTREEATNFVAQIEGTACVRFYRRADGTVLTSDCPVGVRRRRRRRFLALAVTAVSAMSAGVYAFATTPGSRCSLPRGSSIEVRGAEVESAANERPPMIMGGIRPNLTGDGKHRR